MPNLHLHLAPPRSPGISSTKKVSNYGMARYVVRSKLIRHNGLSSTCVRAPDNKNWEHKKCKRQNPPGLAAAAASSSESPRATFLPADHATIPVCA